MSRYELSVQLFEACKKRNLDEDDKAKIIKLIEKGADINFYYEQTVPMINILKNHENSYFALHLIKTYDVNVHKGGRGHTILQQACCSENTNLVEIILEKGADPNESGVYGEVPLENAIAFDNIELIKLLIKHGAIIDYKWASDPSLIDAVRYGSLFAFIFLIENGADINAKDRNNKSVIDHINMKLESKWTEHKSIFKEMKEIFETKSSPTISGNFIVKFIKNISS